MSVPCYLQPDDWLGIIFRLSLALFIGGLIGWEREIRNKPAGLRTYMLVSFGSALFVIVFLQNNAGAQDSDALSRVIQGIVTGVGFLGGGVIFHESQQENRHVKIRGLTSAAAIWVSAALGTTAGFGLWQISLISAAMVLFVLVFVKKIEPRN